MPSLTLYIDLSPNFPFAFSAIEQRRVELAQGGYFLPTTPPWPMQGFGFYKRKPTGKSPPYWRNAETVCGFWHNMRGGLYCTDAQ